MKSFALCLSVLALVACKPAAEANVDAVPSTVAPAATVASPVHAAAPTMQPAPSARTITAPDIDAYELTTTNVESLIRVQVALDAAMQRDPGLEPAMDFAAETPTQYIERLEATPALRSAIEGAGMSVHDFAYTSQALVSALMAVAMVEAGHREDIPAGVSKHNAEFARVHGKAIQARMMALAAGQD